MRRCFRSVTFKPYCACVDFGSGGINVPSIGWQDSAAALDRGVSRDLLHAAEILYAIGEFDLVLSFVTDIAEASSDIATLTELGELTARYNDAQAMLAIGKTTLARGLPTERYAFPEIGVPSYKPIAPPIDHCVIYSIVRTESAFDQRDMSPAWREVGVPPNLRTSQLGDVWI